MRFFIGVAAGVIGWQLLNKKIPQSKVDEGFEKFLLWLYDHVLSSEDLYYLTDLWLKAIDKKTSHIASEPSLSPWPTDWWTGS